MPITELLKTGKVGAKLQSSQPLEWTLECQGAFEKLKWLFTEELVLKHHNPKEPFVIQADASNVVMGAILQRNKEGNLQPYAYISRKLINTVSGVIKDTFVVR